MGYSRWSYYGFFKPSIKECLCSIAYAHPNALLKATHYELQDGDLTAKNIMGNYHWFPILLHERPKR